MHKDYISLKPLVPVTADAFPLDQEALFGRTGLWEVEIGFGNGDYLVRQARENPGTDFLGLELTWRPVKSALRKISLAGAANVRLMACDARIAFEYGFTPKSLRRIWALFPYPWPKKRHVRHRLFSRSFLRLMNNRMAEGGEFFMVTDDTAFGEWVAREVPGTGFHAEQRSGPPRFGTKFEKIWQAGGKREFTELSLKKTEHIPLELEETVPMRTHRVKAFSPRTYKPEGTTGRELTVRFTEFLFDPEKKKGMQFVLVSEDGRTQHFWIEIAKKGDGWLIRPAAGSPLLPTKGVQAALDLAGRACRA